MILDQIKQANVQAMKDHDKTARTIYSVVMNKAMQMTIEKRSKGEEFTDPDMVAILQKTIKELGDEAENYKKANYTEQYNEVLAQQKLIEGYLPKMLSEQEIYDIIAALDDKSIPTVMKHFKANYAGKCEMRLVQEVLKKFN